MQTAKISAFVLGLAIVTSACGDSMSSLNPTAPSSLSPHTLNVETDAASGEMGNGPKPGNGNNAGGNGNGNANGRQPALTTTNPTSNRIQIEGPIDVVGNGSVTVTGQLVAVTSETVVRHGDSRLQLSDLQAGDRVHLTAVRAQSSNGLATLQATEIKLQNPGESDGEEPPPAPTGLVSVVASDASAMEGAADTATFRLTRAGDATLLASPLTVSFTLTGSALNGTDYALLPTTVTFAANSNTVDVVVSPLADSAAEGSETVLLTLTGASPYELGSPVVATATIQDPAGPTVSVAALDDSANEDVDLFDFGAFVLTRTGNLSAPLSVTVTFTGTAANGTDYQNLSTTIDFAPGVATATVVVVPNPDGVSEPDETVIITVVDGANYDPGTPATATVTIVAS